MPRPCGWSAFSERGQANHSADEGGSRAPIETPAPGNSYPVILLFDLYTREIAPRRADNWVERLVAETRLRRRIDRGRAEGWHAHWNPAGRGVDLRQRHDDFEPLRERAGEPARIGWNQDLEQPDAFGFAQQSPEQSCDALRTRAIGPWLRLPSRGPQPEIADGRRARPGMLVLRSCAEDSEAASKLTWASSQSTCIVAPSRGP